MTRAVVDSSVLVSALIAGRDTPPSQVLRAWARKRFEHVTRDEVADLLDMPRSNAVVHPDPAVVERATRDPRDDYLVALAKTAEALLVSSDRDLLDTDIGDLEVLNARDFLDRLACRPEPFSQPMLPTLHSGRRLHARRCSAIAARPIR